MLDDRFWTKVDKSSPNGCWEWTATKNNKGYGCFSARQIIPGRKTKALAHRLSYAYFKGPIPPGQNILHSCDNPACVNPDHLRAGSQSENISESVAKGRKPLANIRGEQIGTSRLTAEKVFSIREKYLAGVPRAQIASEADISEVTIKRVVSGRSWQHLIGLRGQTIERLNAEKAKREKAGSVLTAEHIPYIRAEIATGRSNQDIADELGVHRRTIADIRNGITWRDV